MLTRFVRTQLIIFTIASIVGILAMVLVYMQAPTLLGIGRMTVKLELPRTGGLYQFSNVTYRGVQIGKVTDVDMADAISRLQAAQTAVQASAEEQFAAEQGVITKTLEEAPARSAV